METDELYLDPTLYMYCCVNNKYKKILMNFSHIRLKFNHFNVLGKTSTGLNEMYAESQLHVKLVIRQKFKYKLSSILAF
jgi:hypothetical protein